MLLSFWGFQKRSSAWHGAVPKYPVSKNQSMSWRFLVDLGVAPETAVNEGFEGDPLLKM